MSLLDCSKAFDTVVFSKLFNILIRKGLCPLITRLLINLYCNIEASVVWNNHYSEKFKVNVGVKQGGVISPVLFSLYIDLLTDRIINSNVGCYVGDVCSSVLVYADDIVLIAPSRTGMQKLLNVCQDFGREYNLLYNPDKCEVIMFGTNKNIKDLTLHSKTIPVKNKVKHLGNYLNNNTTDLFDFKNLISDLKIRTNVLLSNFRFLETKSRRNIYNSNCNSFYGCELTNVMSKNLIDLEDGV